MNSWYSWLFGIWSAQIFLVRVQQNRRFLSYPRRSSVRARSPSLSSNSDGPLPESCGRSVLCSAKLLWFYGDTQDGAQWWPGGWDVRGPETVGVLFHGNSWNHWKAKWSNHAKCFHSNIDMLLNCFWYSTAPSWQDVSTFFRPERRESCDPVRVKSRASCRMQL